MNGRPRRASPVIPVLIGTVLLVVVSVALIVGLAPGPRASASASAPPTRPAAALIDVDRLAANGLRGLIGATPFVTLRDDVLTQARRALQREPRPGDLPGALGDFRDDGKAALALAIASVIGDDPRHARGVAKYLDAWASGSTVDPACREADCDRAARIARELPAFVFAADLVRGTPAMTTELDDRIDAWLTELRPGRARWVDGRGDADVLAMMVVSAVVDDAAGFDQAVDEWRERLDVLAADGRLTVAPSGSPIEATQDALTYRLLAARIAGDRGVDLLVATGSSGASIRTAVDHLATNWDDPTAWPTSGSISQPPAGALWEMAASLWPDPRFIALRDEYRATDGGTFVAVRWSTLFEAPLTATVDPSAPNATPTPAPTQTPAPTPTRAPTQTPAPTPTRTPGPVAAAPAVAFRPGPVRADRAAVRVTWPAARRAEGDESAITYDLDSARDDGDPRRIASGTRRRADTTIVPGHRYALRVRATSAAAGAGPWSDELRVTFRRAQETDRAVRVTGSWSSAASSAYSDGRVRYSTARGATLSFTFRGRAVAIRGPIGPTRGQMDVRVDGVDAGRVDLRAADFVASVALFTRAWTTDGDHTVELRVVGSGRPVAVDAIDVLDGGG